MEPTTAVIIGQRYQGKSGQVKQVTGIRLNGALIDYVVTGGCHKGADGCRWKAEFLRWAVADVTPRAEVTAEFIAGMEFAAEIARKTRTRYKCRVKTADQFADAILKSIPIS